MRNSVISILLALTELFCFTACGDIDQSAEQSNETELITTYENVDESAETTETETIEDITIETTVAEITETEIQTTISEINNDELNKEDFVSLGEFSFPIAEGFTDNGTSDDPNAIYFENSGQTIVIAYFNDDANETIDALHQMAESKNVVFSWLMEYNGLYGCYYCDTRKIDKPVICAVVTASDSANLIGNTPHLMIEVLNFSGYTEAMSALSVTLENIICDTSDIQPYASDES